MEDLNNAAFIGLFREAFQKCFGYAIVHALSETESRHFSNVIFETTGLIIGAKSIKNYSIYILSDSFSKEENPSIATLDTLARYVYNAPYTDEVKRREHEGHYPYWFKYKNQYSGSNIVSAGNDQYNFRVNLAWINWKRFMILASLASLIVLIVLLFNLFNPAISNKIISEDFHTLQEDSLTRNGWFIKSKETNWWNRRNEFPSRLKLFTLRGDNWPDSANTASIKNLLLRKLTSECFTAEIQFENFIPAAKWQQAGILLLEDTMLSGKSLRMSIAYNDFFGGFKKPAEIIIQVISSEGKNPNNPEEIVHLPIFTIEKGTESLLTENLKKSALKIEKNGIHYRFLYGTGPVENFSFKEIISKDLVIKPHYLGLFAMQGFVNDTIYMPVYLKLFRLVDSNCEK